VEAEPERDREADRPVAEEVRVERIFRVARAAQHARADRLNAVRELPHGGDDQQRDGDTNDVGLICDESRERVRKHGEREFGERHHGCTEVERDMARDARRDAIARADIQADAYRSRHGDAECDRKLVRQAGNA